ncbi:MAG: methylated-DNA-protein-cysteine methyltransferase related protein [Fimbriimonadaceae bacterium]|jgi:methylated-DNA-protein-cysteine methyltransferase-like protein|nr:methylated-DNA-protein-cysteine methyltransferase related protein [Fimbriimonadaceae bacterium]
MPTLKSEILAELWTLVASIPRGRVASYGEVGRALSHPSSGYMVGRWMAQAPEGLPWWRVVGKNGELRTASRDPRLAELQMRHLLQEKVRIQDGAIDMSLHAHYW